MRFFVQKAAKRKATYALSDMELSEDRKTVYMSDADFIEYQKAKALYEKWQVQFAHVQRYGW